MSLDETANMVIKHTENAKCSGIPQTLITEIRPFLHIFHLASKFSKDWAEIPNVTMRLTKLQFYLRKCLKAVGMMLPKTGKSGICNNVMLQICLTFILHIAIISRKTCCNPLLVLFHPKRAFFGFLGAQFSFFICTKIAIPN